MLYEMATGKLPFRGESYGEIFDSILNRAPTPATRLNPELPAALERIIDKCLEKDRDLRYQHASEIRADLQRLRRDSDSASVVSAPPARGFSKRWKLAALAVLVVLVLSSAGYYYLHRPPKIADLGTVILADFTNKTGDPVFDDTLRQGLEVQLGQSPFLRIISDDKMRSTLKQMGRRLDEPLNDELAREVCERNQSKVFISGSIATLGSQYVLGLKAVNCLTGETVAEQQAQVSRKEEVLNALTKQSSLLRGKLGESLASIQKFDFPLEQATTPSLEALQDYSLAIKQFYLMNYASAGTLLQRAIDLDPNFAVAYARLASLNYNNSQSEAALENSARLMRYAIVSGTVSAFTSRPVTTCSGRKRKKHRKPMNCGRVPIPRTRCLTLASL